MQRRIEITTDLINTMAGLDGTAIAIMQEITKGKSLRTQRVLDLIEVYRGQELPLSFAEIMQSTTDKSGWERITRNSVGILDFYQVYMLIAANNINRKRENIAQSSRFNRTEETSYALATLTREFNSILYSLIWADDDAIIQELYETSSFYHSLEIGIRQSLPLETFILRQEIESGSHDHAYFAEI